MFSEFSQPSVIVVGVGRSGTTALFRNMYTAYTGLQVAPLIRYEPFLWDVREVPDQSTFGQTNLLSASGIAAHCGAPMFFRGHQNADLERHVSFMSLNETPFLIKYIRACGRIDFFLRKWPDARFVFIFREPCGVVNSVVDKFSFFGDEFHRSDETRFALETGRASFAQLPYALKQLAYWRDMNEAAHQSAEIHPDRILSISQEALQVNPQQTMDAVIRYCFGDDAAERLEGILPEWPVNDNLLPSYGHLTPPLYEDFLSEIDWYLQVLLPSCQSGVDLNLHNIRSSILQGSIRGLRSRKANDASDVVEDLPRNLQPLTLRQKLLAAQKELIALREELIPLRQELLASQSELGELQRCNEKRPRAKPQAKLRYLISVASKGKRIWHAYRLIVGSPIPVRDTRFIAQQRDLEVSSQARAGFLRRGLTSRLWFYVNAALGRSMQMKHFLEAPEGWEHYQRTVIVRRGSILQRFFVCSKYLWSRDVRLSEFSHYRYVE